jgi:TRAP-type C4-dicarboxylate transport system permease small subunit
MQTIVRGWFRLLNITLVACLGAMVVLVFGNVVLRYAFNSGLEVSEELSRLLFLISTFLGAIVAMRERLHLGVDSLVRRLGHRGRIACLVLSQLGMLGCTGLLLVGSWQQMVINLDTTMPVTGVSMAIFYGTGVVFGISVGLMLLHDLYRALTGHLAEDEAVIVQASEDGDMDALAQAAAKAGGGVVKQEALS